MLFLNHNKTQITMRKKWESANFDQSREVTFLTFWRTYDAEQIAQLEQYCCLTPGQLLVVYDILQWLKQSQWNNSPQMDIYLTTGNFFRLKLQNCENTKKWKSLYLGRLRCHKIKCYRNVPVVWYMYLLSSIRDHPPLHYISANKLDCYFKIMLLGFKEIFVAFWKGSSTNYSIFSKLYLALYETKF